MTTTTATRIGQIHVVMVPSTDQDRSIAFYEALGFEKRLDVPFAEHHRWVEMFPPDGVTGVALVAPGPGESGGTSTGVLLTTDDIDATHAQLRSSGVDVDAQVARPGTPARIRIGAAELAGPVPPMFWFRDPDGNTLLIVEAG
jgi:catechol 2,3-dioxygenase-like lactoylglutathione lyase family enzyme